MSTTDLIQSYLDIWNERDTVLGTHHDRALFTWKLGTVATGYDVVEFAGDRIHSVIGFFA